METATYMFGAVSVLCVIVASVPGLASKNVTVFFYALAFCFTVLAATCWWLDKEAKKSPVETGVRTAPVEEERRIYPPSVYEMFKGEFPFLAFHGHGKYGVAADFKPIPVPVDYKVWFDVDSKSKFLSVYIPQTPLTLELFQAFAEGGFDAFLNSRSGDVELPEKGTLGATVNVEPNGNDVGRILVNNGADLSSMDALDFRFTGSVYLYYDGELTPAQIGALEELYRTKSLAVKLRGITYTLARWSQLQAEKKDLRNPRGILAQRREVAVLRGYAKKYGPLMNKLFTAKQIALNKEYPSGFSIVYLAKPDIIAPYRSAETIRIDWGRCQLRFEGDKATLDLPEIHTPIGDMPYHSVIFSRTFEPKHSLLRSPTGNMYAEVLDTPDDGYVVAIGVTRED